MLTVIFFEVFFEEYVWSSLELNNNNNDSCFQLNNSTGCYAAIFVYLLC